MSQVDQLQVELGELDRLLQDVIDLAFWGPRGPGDGKALDEMDGTDVPLANAAFRLGAVIGTLARAGYRPTPRPPARERAT